MLSNKKTRLEKADGGLTQKQHYIAHRLADGCTDKIVAAECGNRSSTVNRHISNIMKKYDVHTRTHAITTAIRLGHLSLSGDCCSYGVRNE